jgi:ATP-dependent Clp protease protease subunit
MTNLMLPQARYVLPQMEQRRNGTITSMDPYSRLFQERIVFLSSPIDDTSASDIIAQLLALDVDDPESDIFVYVNSGGGSVTAMNAIVDTMNYLRAPVSTVALGIAASAAAVLLAAGSKGRRMALPNARIMIHQPRGGAEGSMQASDIAIIASEMNRSREWMENFLAEKTGRSAKEISDLIERDKWLSAEEAVELGLIDKIVERR